MKSAQQRISGRMLIVRLYLARLLDELQRLLRIVPTGWCSIL
jgi:hypothetical protein